MNGRRGGLDGRHMQVTLPQERSDVEDVDSQPQTHKHTNADTDLNEPGKSHPTLNIQVSASVICLNLLQNQMPIKLFTKRPWQMLIRAILYFACEDAGVSIIFKIRVFHKARFEGFDFFIRWPYAVFQKMQVVFYEKVRIFVLPIIYEV